MPPKSEPQRITKTRAKSEFGLTDNDLKALTCVEKRNPHYRRAAPMQLYLLDEVAALSERKKSTVPLTAEEKAYVRAEAAKNAASAVAAFDVEERPVIGGNSPLTIQAWVEVFRALAGEINAIRDPCLAARDVCAAAAICRDARIAAKQVVEELDAMLPRPNPDFEIVVKNPQKLTVAKLKAICAELDLQVSGTKPILILRALCAFGLSAPSHGGMPVALFLEAKNQRDTRLQDMRDRDLYEIVKKIRLMNKNLFSYMDSVWSVRRTFMEAYPEMKDFDSEYEFYEIMSRKELCECGNKHSISCVAYLCRQCCKARGLRCERHRF